MFTSQISGKSLARREMRKICQFDSLANSGPPGGGDIRLTTGKGRGVQGEGDMLTSDHREGEGGGVCSRLTTRVGHSVLFRLVRSVLFHS